MFQEFKELLKLSWPVSLGYIAGILMQIVDAMFVGRVGPVALAAVALGSTAFSVAFVFGIGMLSGLDFLISRDVGAKNYKQCGRWLFHAGLICLIYSVPVSFLLQFSEPIFRLFSIDENIVREAMLYLKTMAPSLVPFLLFLSFRQYLQAFGIVKPATLIILAANIVNAIANWILIFGHFGFSPHGVKGAAYATLISRIYMCIHVLVYVYSWNKKNGYIENYFHQKIYKKYVTQIFQIGLPSSFQMLLEVAVFALSTILAGKLGAIPLATQQIVLNIASFTFMIPLGMSNAASVKVGQAVGEQDFSRVERRGWSAFALGLAMMAFVGSLLFIFKVPIVEMFTKDQQIITSAVRLMLLVAFFQIFDATQVIGAGVLRGIGQTKPAMIANFVGHWCIGLPIGATLCFKLGYGIVGLWIGLTVGLIAVALSLTYYWKVWLNSKPDLQKIHPVQH